MFVFEHVSNRFSEIKATAFFMCLTPETAGITQLNLQQWEKNI